MGEVFFDREVNITLFKKTSSFPNNFFSLKQMNLPLNIPVSDLRIMKRVGYWDGEKLSPTLVSTLEGTKIPSVNFSILCILLIVSGIILVSISIIMKFREKKKYEKFSY
ncbi:MAG: hypothetical protein LBJ67_04495 [Planctomycetaceae bacterium]|jgi:hypothetical protein|nr:hypothetical protein [Planctomycetaceae bacterium]